MNKHTPGPWSINPKGGTPMVGIDLQDGGELLPIVEVVYGYNNAEAKANAHLIAAAPELLEALKNLLDACLLADIYLELSDKVDGSLMDSANKAIAKATGEGV